jgi:hypothetical protein
MFEDIRVVTRSREYKKIKTTMTKRKRRKEETTTNKVLHRKLKIEQHDPH